jgi:hypothetical protein
MENNKSSDDNSDYNHGKWRDTKNNRIKNEKSDRDDNNKNKETVITGMTTTEAKAAAAATTQESMMTIKQKLQPKTQNNNNMETLTMAAWKTVAMETVATIDRSYRVP